MSKDVCTLHVCKCQISATGKKITKRGAYMYMYMYVALKMTCCGKTLTFH